LDQIYKVPVQFILLNELFFNLVNYSFIKAVKNFYTYKIIWSFYVNFTIIRCALNEFIILCTKECVERKHKDTENQKNI